ncbi:MAG: helix-turn-helix transcriptional regulator [Clostridia bacterium]|nr:helix-turn-helix transcriptional regulator [Clostridia bacterium]
MKKIDLNKNIIYKGASYRYFDKNECHCSRFCEQYILLIVFDGVLRFSEDGEEFEVFPGEYFIQRKNAFQDGKIPSDSPKYLYVHFDCEETEGDGLVFRGKFDYNQLEPFMTKIDDYYHNDAPYILQVGKFYEILSTLYQKEKKATLADKIAEYIMLRFTEDVTLDEISKKFNFSKNHIINIFRNKYDMTPFEFLGKYKIRQAERLLEITSDSAEEISSKCGFNNYSHFYKLFRRMNNVSPNRWRQEKRK